MVPMSFASSRATTSPSCATFEISMISSYLNRLAAPVALRNPAFRGPKLRANAICSPSLSGWSWNTSTACRSSASSIARTAAGSSGLRRSTPLASAANSGLSGFSFSLVAGLALRFMDVIRRTTPGLGCEFSQPATPHFTPRPTIAPSAMTTAPTGTSPAPSAAAASASARVRERLVAFVTHESISHRQSR